MADRQALNDASRYGFVNFKALAETKCGNPEVHEMIRGVEDDLEQIGKLSAEIRSESEGVGSIESIDHIGLDELRELNSYGLDLESITKHLIPDITNFKEEESKEIADTTMESGTDMIVVN